MLHSIHRRILTEDLAHRVRDFAKRAPGANCVDDRRHEIVAVARGGLDSRERFAGRLRITFGTHSRNACLLLLLELGLDPESFTRGLAAASKLVDSYDNSLLAFQSRADK